MIGTTCSRRHKPTSEVRGICIVSMGHGPDRNINGENQVSIHDFQRCGLDPAESSHDWERIFSHIAKLVQKVSNGRLRQRL